MIKFLKDNWKQIIISLLFIIVIGFCIWGLINNIKSIDYFYKLIDYFKNVTFGEYSIDGCNKQIIEHIVGSVTYSFSTLLLTISICFIWFRKRRVK